MTELADRLVIFLVFATVPAAVLFPLLYAVSTRWWETLVGRALLVMTTSTMLLMGLALLVRGTDVSPDVLAVLRMAIMTLIFLGVNGMFLALLREQGPRFLRWLRARRERRTVA